MKFYRSKPCLIATDCPSRRGRKFATHKENEFQKWSFACKLCKTHKDEEHELVRKQRMPHVVELCIAVLNAKEEGTREESLKMRETQTEFYASRNPSAEVVFCSARTMAELTTVVGRFKRNNHGCVVARIWVMCHGDTNGNAYFGDTPISPEILYESLYGLTDPDPRTNGLTIIKFIHCYAHVTVDTLTNANNDQQINQGIFTYQFGIFQESATVFVAPVTYNVPLAHGGYIHTGLNPEAIHYPQVFAWVAQHGPNFAN